MSWIFISSYTLYWQIQNRTSFSEILQIILISQFPYLLSLNHGVNIIEKGYKKTVCPDGKYFHQNKLFFIFTLIIFSEHSYFLRKSQITPERKQRKKYFSTPFALHRNIQTARKAFIYGLFRNLVRYSNSASPKILLNIFV